VSYNHAKARVAAPEGSSRDVLAEAHVELRAEKRAAAEAGDSDAAVNWKGVADGLCIARISLLMLS